MPFLDPDQRRTVRLGCNPYFKQLLPAGSSPFHARRPPIDQSETTSPLSGTSEDLETQDARPVPVTTLKTTHSTTFSHNPYSSLKVTKRTKIPATDSSAKNTPSSPVGLPKWYLRPTYECKHMHMPSGQRDAFATMKSTQEYIKTILEAHPRPVNLTLQGLCKRVHELAVCEVSKWAIFQTNFFDHQYGLVRIFLTPDSGYKFPWYIRADAKVLFNRWAKDRLDGNIFYGQVLGKNGHMKLDLTFPTTDSKVYGDNGLENGAWFPNRAAARREGAHGQAQAGIHGSDQGAYSVVISSQQYQDIDNGDEVEYYGTDQGSGDHQTSSTRYLRNSITSRNPIRVLRCSTLREDNPYRPSEGYRYDGLYTADSSVLEDADRQRWRVKLRRIPGQDPIRCGDDGSQRPTQQELAALEKHWKLQSRIGEA